MMEIFEIDRQLSPSALREGIRKSEPVVYNSNGNRSTSPRKLKQILKRVLPRVGVKRIADISFLAATDYPVYQSCRPNVFYHTRLGQNSGSQGKGPHKTQAFFSCAMETIEGYCAEPRNPVLIRASYDFLRRHQVVLDPRIYVPSEGQAAVAADEVIMWTPAYHVEMDCEVLVPAECVFFPFLPKIYKTEAHFPSSSNGLASGSTYLEAAIHGLYEVIERHYCHLLEEGKVKIEALHEEELGQIGIEETKAALRGEYELQLYCVEIPGIKNLPLVTCALVGNEMCFYGIGCSATVDISIDRAISEALQSQATRISGSREDIEQQTKITGVDSTFFGKTAQPERRTLRIAQYRRRVYDLKFKNLRDEFDFAVKWAGRLGYKNILLANLTRSSVGIPCVKVVVPEMSPNNETKGSSDFDLDLYMSCFFPNIRHVGHGGEK
jgi:ribosomal protein S12 methylthiotransferase accessory factor